jgi:hypothetical protein
MQGPPEALSERPPGRRTASTVARGKAQRILSNHAIQSNVKVHSKSVCCGTCRRYCAFEQRQLYQRLAPDLLYRDTCSSVKLLKARPGFVVGT